MDQPLFTIITVVVTAMVAAGATTEREKERTNNDGWHDYSLANDYVPSATHHGLAFGQTMAPGLNIRTTETLLGVTECNI